MLKKVNLTCTKKNQNPTYYGTTKFWEKNLSSKCVKIEKNKSNLILKGNGALNGHKYILLYMLRY